MARASFRRFGLGRFQPVQPVYSGPDLLQELRAVQQCGARNRRELFATLDAVRDRHLSDIDGKSTDYLLYVIKSCNLVGMEWEYRHGFTKILSRPTNYILDCTNNCQLGCGNCQHTLDRDHAEAAFLPLRGGAMSRKVHRLVETLVSPYAFAADYYNQSESLLNKLAPAFLAAASKRRVFTTVSSNFEMPGLDIDALIGSGLNFLDLSIDGATQETYERYRRGGNLERVLDNVRALVRARGDNPTPHLRWKFLAFEHNVHEIDQAKSLARAIGVDQIAFSPAMPGPGGQTAAGFDVEQLATKSFERFTERTGLGFATANEDIREEVQEIAARSLASRLEECSARDDTFNETAPGDGWCDWLYYCPAFDAHGLVRSCANPDYRDRGSLVYGDIVRDGEDYFNSERFQEARRATVSRTCLLPARGPGDASDDIGCRRCPERPSPCSQLANAAGWQMSMGKEIGQSNASRDAVMAMAGWSRHSRYADD